MKFQIATRMPTNINSALNHSNNGKQADFANQVGSARGGSGNCPVSFCARWQEPHSQNQIR
jgi:hypothetical protein